MLYRTIKKIDLKVSVVGLGTWVFGGRGWGGTSEKDCREAVAAAADCGINLIDTAPVYGNGQSEEMLGRLLKGQRNKFILATKCGLRRAGRRLVHDLSPVNLKKEIDDSLRRLQCGHIDIYQCHWPDAATPLSETIAALAELRARGKVRFFGVSNFDTALLKEAVQSGEILSTQNRFSLLDRGIEGGLLPFCVESELPVFAYGALAGGVLSGKYRSPPAFRPNDARSFFYRHYAGEGFVRPQRLLMSLADIGRPLNQIAINWVRQRPGITSVLVGCRNARQVRDNAASVDWDLTSADHGLIETALTLKDEPLCAPTS